jgi:hypothetical protein
MDTIANKVITLTDIDALVVTEDNTLVRRVTIRDEAPPELLGEAHRDGIQLYKPIVNGRFNAQFAASELNDIEIRDCDIQSPGKLQCIFASDGLLRRPTVVGNTLDTQGAHFISLALVEGFIADNLRPDGSLAPINLYPLSIGGNSDGKLRVLVMSFRDSLIEYAPTTEVVRDGTYDHVRDFRFKERDRSPFVHLYNFDSEGFREAVLERQLTANAMRELALDFGTTEKPTSVYVDKRDETVEKIFDPLDYFGKDIINPKTGHPLRNYGANNPGNIKDFGIKWRGRVDPDATFRMHGYQVREVSRVNNGKADHMVVFEHPRDGFRALALDLLNKQRRHKLKSIRAIMNRYAPKGKENPAQEAYIWNIASKVGAKPDEVIALSDWTTMRNFIEAIVVEEAGASVGNLYPEEWIVEGMVSAGVPYPGEEDPSRPLTESRTVKAGVSAGSGLATTGVIEVVQAVSGQDTVTIEALAEAVNGNIDKAANLVLSNQEKLDEITAMIQANSTWSTMDYVQLVLLGITAFGVIDMLSDRKLSRLLKIK